jgi:hypothetical protein
MGPSTLPNPHHQEGVSMSELKIGDTIDNLAEMDTLSRGAVLVSQSERDRVIVKTANGSWFAVWEDESWNVRHDLLCKMVARYNFEFEIVSLGVKEIAP